MKKFFKEADAIVNFKNGKDYFNTYPSNIHLFQGYVLYPNYWLYYIKEDNGERRFQENSTFYLKKDGKIRISDLLYVSKILNVDFLKILTGRESHLSNLNGDSVEKILKPYLNEDNIFIKYFSVIKADIWAMEYVKSRPMKVKGVYLSIFNKNTLLKLKHLPDIEIFQHTDPNFYSIYSSNNTNEIWVDNPIASTILKTGLVSYPRYLSYFEEIVTDSNFLDDNFTSSIIPKDINLLESHDWLAEKMINDALLFKRGD